MRCRKHPTDYSSSVGVCASCLRHRLLSVIAAQQQQPPGGADDDHIVVFPRSVSPYVAPRRNSLLLQQEEEESVFYYNGSDHTTPEKNTKKKMPKKSLFSRIILFRSRSEKPPGDPPRVSSSSSSSWISFFKGTSELPSCGPSRVLDHRGMSPVRDDDYASDAYKMTSFTRRHHARSSSSSSAISSFCLSPLVWATPLHRHNMSSSEAAADLRPSSRIHLSSASAFCANRSRKLADFGRFTPNR